MISSFAGDDGLPTGGIYTIADAKAREQNVAEFRDTFDSALSLPFFGDVAGYFDIRQEQWLSHGLASFRPLALPAYFTADSTARAFANDRISLPNPDHEPPFGLTLVRPQPLLRHMHAQESRRARGTINIPREQIFHYWLAPGFAPIASLTAPLMLSVGEDRWSFASILHQLGIREEKAASDDHAPLVFRDTLDQRLPEPLIRQYLMIQFVVRTAFITGMVHTLMQGATGSIFESPHSILTANALGPLGVLDFRPAKVSSEHQLPLDPSFGSMAKTAAELGTAAETLWWESGPIMTYYRLLGGDQLGFDTAFLSYVWDTMYQRALPLDALRPVPKGIPQKLAYFLEAGKLWPTTSPGRHQLNDPETTRASESSL